MDTSQANVGFVRGTQPGFRDETRELLRGRLFAASLAFMGILMFAFVGNIVLGNYEWWWVRVAFLGTLIACLYLLRKSNLPSLKTLRILEVVIFGVFYLQLAMMMTTRLINYSALGEVGSVAAVRYGYLAAFSILILGYGIFVPNAWKRSAIVIISMAVGPYIILLLLYQFDSKVALNFNAITYSSPVPITLMAAIVGVYGSHAINVVRREAFKARRFGQYQLGDQLGVGGMGEVYKAEHLLLKRPCAIKLIRSDNSTKESAILAFENEVRATAKLTHWNTVEIFDYGRTDDGTFYYVMELLPGLSLQELVDKHGPQNPARVCNLLVQLCDALDEAHGMGLIHRDIKPQNIFVSQLGRQYDVAKLLDFGLVKEQKAGEGTKSRGFCGTPDYMSPEQATNYDEVGPPSDIYALGCVGYFALTGRTPFVKDDIMETLRAHAKDEPDLPSSLNPAIPSDLEQVISNCLKKIADDRYDSAADLKAALQQLACHDDWSNDHAVNWWENHEHQMMESASAQ